MNWPIRRPIQRSEPVKMTLAQFKEKIADARERRLKRFIKRKQLGHGPTKSTVKSQLDHLWSLVIRRRDRALYAGLCLVCIVKRQLGVANYEPQPIEVAYHIEPRGDELVRWRLDNGVGACSRCNDGEKWSRSGGRAKVRAVYERIHAVLVGEAKLAELKALARQTADYSVADLIEKRDELKTLLEGRA